MVLLHRHDDMYTFRQIAIPLLGLMLLAASPLDAQSVRAESGRKTSVHLIGADQEHRVDGKLDEPFWRLARPADSFRQLEPKRGAPATRRTDVRMIFTDDAVLIGAWLQDDRIALLQASRLDPDAQQEGYIPDYFRVQLDPHPGHPTLFEFIVTVRGEMKGSLISNGASVDSWSVNWEAATHADEHGWSLEIRVPYSELHVEKGAEDWAVAFERFSWRRGETDVLDTRPARRVAERR